MAPDGTMIGRRIRQRREDAGLSLSEVGRRSQVSKSYLSALEQGKATQPGAETVAAIAAALGTTTDDLLGKPANPTSVEIPEALAELAEAEGLTAEDVKMLAAVHWRGRQPQAVAGWRHLLDTLRCIVRQGYSAHDSATPDPR